MINPLVGWILFNLLILAVLAVDLGVFHRKSHAVSVREALGWTAVWVALALLFDVGLYYYYAGYSEGPDVAHQKATEFLTGYVIEEALSVDNLFVFLVIFNYFQVPAKYQHKVLFWGIIGAAVLRLLFILGGTLLLHTFDWMMWIFGGFLVFTGIKLAISGDESVEPEKNLAIRFFRRWLPVAANYEGEGFFTRQNGRLLATPLLLVLLVVDVTDVIFAVDSIPAVLSVTQDPFIAYSSNAFAILGLRSLYFALAAMMGIFRYLSYGLSAVLVFIGGKMIAEQWNEAYKIKPGYSLSIVLLTLLVSVVASLLLAPRRPVANEEAELESVGQAADDGTSDSGDSLRA